MVGDNSYTGPARIKKNHDPICNRVDLTGDLVNQSGIELVAQFVDLTDLSPSAFGNIGSHPDLAALDHVHALAFHRLAQPFRIYRLLAGRDDWREVFRAGGAFEQLVRR